MAKIKITAQTRYVGSKDYRTVTVDDEDLEDMDDKDREKYLEEVATEALWDIIEWGWEEVR